MEEGVLRSEMRPCKACDEISGSSDSDIPGIRIQEFKNAAGESCSSCEKYAGIVSGPRLSLGTRQVKQKRGSKRMKLIREVVSRVLL